MAVILILLGLLGLAGTVQAQTYIMGHVKDTGGSGIGDVLVLLYDAQTMNQVAGIYTDDEGLYELDYTNSGDPIPLGTYKVQAVPGSDYYGQWYQGKDEAGEADLCILTSGVPFLEEIDFILTAKKPMGNLEGQVTDADTAQSLSCLLYTSPSPRDRTRSRMPSSA